MFNNNNNNNNPVDYYITEYVNISQPKLRSEKFDDDDGNNNNNNNNNNSDPAVVMMVQVLRTQECPISNVDPKAEYQKLIYSRLPCCERGAGMASKSKHWVFSVSPLGPFVPTDISIKLKPMTIVQWPS